MQPISIHVETLRGGHLESLSRVRAIVLPVGAGPDTPPLFESGDGQAPAFWRSAAKFIQALSLFHSGAMERFAFSRDELALACASHSGGDAHVAVAAGMLAKLGLPTDALHCGPHIPLGSPEAKLLAERGEAPTRLHNNCSGKHSGMLAVCLARGWPVADYNRLHHPLQQEILRHLSQVTEVPLSQIDTAVDGCGAVVFRSPLRSLALGYLRLVHGALPEPHRAPGEQILSALRTAPRMVAGSGRLCTSLVEVTAGRLVGKVGADGLYALGAQGQGSLALKIEDGNSRVTDAVVFALLAHLGWLSAAELETLRPYSQLPLFNHQREQVGESRVLIG
ncbi:MAG TPA: asparaginase [Pseudomonadota bacterium]|nr:asparaginase [Pseudomonadota bacterium]